MYINYKIIIQLILGCFICLFFPTDKKIMRLDTDDLDEIEKIAN